MKKTICYKIFIMKKVLYSILLMGCSLIGWAQNSDAILQQIEKSNALYSTIEADFIQTKTLAANGKETKSSGKLYLSGNNQMAMHYEAPSTDLLIINGDEFFMERGKKKNRFNTEKNKTMRNLRNTLLLCLHGKPAQLAEENEATIDLKNMSAGYSVTLTTQKKSPRGYKQIVLDYDKRTYLLTKMKMEEWNGNTTLYEMNNPQTNRSIDEKHYEIPKK